MKDYKKLIEALRVHSAFDMGGCSRCPYAELSHLDCTSTLINDAVEAIEELQSMASKLEERTKAQQERLEDYVEKQCYIDQWGAKWMTSAKDVPTSAYQHGYADGFAEAKQKFQKPD